MTEVINISEQSQETLSEIEKELTFQTPITQYNKFSKSIQLFAVDNDNLYIPKAYYYKKLIESDEKYVLEESKHITNFSFIGKLRENQIQVRNTALERLRTTGSCIISAYPGFGKTFTAINLAYKLKQKTLIICNRLVLISQWETAIKTFLKDATFQILKPKDEMKNVDFYIINAINICKKPREFYSNIQFVIVDECHLILADTIGKCMLHFSPRYLLGLSATSYRMAGFDDSDKAIKTITLKLKHTTNNIEKELLLKDLNYANYLKYKKQIEDIQLKLTIAKGDIFKKLKIELSETYEKMNDLKHSIKDILNDVERQVEHRFTYETLYDDLTINLFFGEFRVSRELVRKHIVYKIKSGIAPDIETTDAGRLKWSTVIDSLSVNTQRNELIVNIVKMFSKRVFLILTKRVEQANFLVNRLQEEKVSVTSLIGSNQIFDKTARVLIGTTGKCSVGFDHPALNTLLLACDLEQYFIQSLGRIFRCQDTGSEKIEDLPMVFDIVDDFGVLEKHFATRKLVYKKHGGIIKNLNGL